MPSDSGGRDLGGDTASDLDGGTDTAEFLDVARPDAAPDAPDVPDTRPPPECEVDQDCNDGSYCNGVDFCDADRQCRVAPAPIPDDGIPCTDDTCAECPLDDADCQPGVEGRVVGTPTEACECDAHEDCEAGPCAVARCNAGVCGVELSEDGSPCTASCELGSRDGVCHSGRCTLAPEGPYLGPACSNGQDDDCDGQIDSGPGCQIATEVGLRVQNAQGHVGPGNGATVVVSPRASGVGMPGQDEHLYCTSRRVQYRSSFDLRTDLDTDLMLSAGRPEDHDEDIRTGVDGFFGRKGLRVCEGRHAIIGAIPFATPEHALLVSMDLGLPEASSRQPPDTHRVVVSYRTDATAVNGADTWIEAGSWRPQDLAGGPIPISFLVEPPTGARRAWLRIDSWFQSDQTQNRKCFWVDDVLVSSERTVQDLSARDRPTWNTPSDSSWAVEGFEGRDAFYAVDWIRATGGEHTMGVLSTSAMGGSGVGLVWSFVNAEWAGIATPEFTGPPAVYDRRQPLIVEFGLDMGPGPIQAINQVGFFMNSSVLRSQRLAANTQAIRLPWVSSRREFTGDNARASLYRVVLPERAKTLRGLDLIWDMDHLGQPVEVHLDEVDVYFHRGSTEDTYAVIEPGPGDRTEYVVRVDGTLEGTYEVRCVWQVGFSNQDVTRVSPPVDVTIQ